MDQMLTVSSSPHLHGGERTHNLMLDVLVALTPTLLLSSYLFGYRALLVAAVSVGSAVLFEYLYRKLMKKENMIADLSAAVTGLLLAFNLPVNIPLWIPVVGSFFAIVVVKQLFGGLGCNFVNPALAARVFLFSWSVHLTTFARPALDFTQYLGADAVTSATPLASLKAGALPSESLFSMLMGARGGCMGETAALLLLAGGLFLLIRGTITWQIPVSFLGTVAVLSLLFPAAGDPVQYMLYELLSGGLILGAFFMATDYVTSPVTGKGKLLFGLGCGLLTVFIRRFGGYPEGVSFSILIMNLLVWFIDKATLPRRFGKGGKRSV